MFTRKSSGRVVGVLAGGLRVLSRDRGYGWGENTSSQVSRVKRSWGVRTRGVQCVVDPCGLCLPNIHFLFSGHCCLIVCGKPPLSYPQTMLLS